MWMVRVSPRLGRVRGEPGAGGAGAAEVVVVVSGGGGGVVDSGGAGADVDGVVGSGSGGADVDAAPCPGDGTGVGAGGRGCNGRTTRHVQGVRQRGSSSRWMPGAQLSRQTATASSLAKHVFLASQHVGLSMQL